MHLGTLPRYRLLRLAREHWPVIRARIYYNVGSSYPRNRKPEHLSNVSLRQHLRALGAGKPCEG